MDTNHISYYACSIHPSKINVYYQSTAGRRRPIVNQSDVEDQQGTNIKQPTQFKDNYHNGRISNIAKRKMTKSIDYLIHMSKPKKVYQPYHGRNFTFTVNFITLSLSSKQIHSDQEIKAKLLNQFLIEMVRRWKVKMYVWRAEKQKNGNIHFHIITGSFIPWNELRNCWNRIQQKLGYVDRYRENQEARHRHGFNYNPKHEKHWPYERQLKAWKKGCETHWDNPNSVDIHSIRHVGNIRAYFSKYMTKNENYTNKQKEEFNKLSEEEKEKIRQVTTVQGKLWSCSNNLSDLRGAYAEVFCQVREELERLQKKYPIYLYNSDYFHVYNISYATLVENDCFTLISIFEDYIRKKFPDDYLKVAL